MGDVDYISSATNPAVKALVRLRQRRERDRRGLFLVEGRREVGRALEGGVEIEAMFAREGAAAPDGPVATRLGAAAFAKVAYRETSEVLAVARQFPTGLDRMSLPADALVLVVESVEKPGNLGAMMRSAAAVGCAAVVAADPVTDVFNPNVVRASLGTMFLLPVAVATGEDVRVWLSRQGVAWWASSEHGTVPYWSAALIGAAAVVVGSEEAGLSAPWLADPGRTLLIPAAGPASLNAATAAALLLFEAQRQRTAAGTQPPR